MALVISDTSTLIHLAVIGRFNLLKDLYQRVVLPAAVWKEAVEEGEGRPGMVEIEAARQSGWIDVVSPGNAPLVSLLQRDLDEGESEVIALAVEKSADLILLDEADARRVAERYGLPKIGVIGVLIRAKQEGKIESLRGELDNLRSRGSFWITQTLYEDALRAAGEA